MSNLIEIPRRGRLRIYGHGELLPGEAIAPESRIVVEWAGRIGHASSYGLLGATETNHLTDTAIELDHEGTNFHASLAGATDQVVFGLLDEYRAAIRAASSVFTFPMTVRIAAHAAIGSSAIVFERLTDLLAPLVYATDAERTDDLVRLWWERAWTAREWINNVELPETYIDLRGTTYNETLERDRLASEIRREVGPGHRLFGQSFAVLARDTARDDVLVSIEPNRVALVHLTYAPPSPDRTPWPIATFVLDKQQLEEQWQLRG